MNLLNVLQRDALAGFLYNIALEDVEKDADLWTGEPSLIRLQILSYADDMNSGKVSNGSVETFLILDVAV